nr:PhoH family protein [Rhodospirillales bacterium]
MTARKTFVLDTSVLLYDSTSIHSFPGNDVIIPLKVLDELDRFKDKPNLVGENARYVNRYLDGLRQMGRLDHGIMIEGLDQTLRIEIQTQKNGLLPASLDANAGDNIILGTVLYLAQDHGQKPLIIVTKDINLRVKCDALGIKAEDYYKDHIEVVESGFYEGVGSTQLSNKQLKELFKVGYTNFTNSDLMENQLIIGTGPNGESALAVKRDNTLRSLGNPENNLATVIKLQPRNKEQAFALWLLNEPTIPLVSITGIAGSGKTFLTLMAGLAALMDGKYERIVITRSIEPVGRDLGYLPGSLDEKIRPWLAPIM